MRKKTIYNRKKPPVTIYDSFAIRLLLIHKKSTTYGYKVLLKMILKPSYSWLINIIRKF